MLRRNNWGGPASAPGGGFFAVVSNGVFFHCSSVYAEIYDDLPSIGDTGCLCQSAFQRRKQGCELLVRATALDKSSIYPLTRSDKFSRLLACQFISETNTNN